MTSKRKLGMTIGLFATALFIAAPGAQALGQYWWVGPCNGGLLGAEIVDANAYPGAVQNDGPLAATDAFAAASAENGVAYANCIVAGTDRVQIVFPGKDTDTVIVEDCRVSCSLAWQLVDGSATLTLKCLDDGETVVWTQSSHPGLSHRCVVESTLARNGDTLSIVAWKTILAS